MRSKFLSFIALAASVSAHYIFGELSVDGVKTKGAIRQFKVNAYTRPVFYYEFNIEDMQCNARSAIHPAEEVVAISPGQKLGFHVTFSVLDGVYHPGFGAIYIAKVPKGVNIKTWFGEGGEWIKIEQWGVESYNPLTFDIKNAPALITTLPNVPSGEYLVRVEHLAIHLKDQAQAWIACGQINVVGGSGTLPKGVAIPGYITGNEQAFHIDVYNNNLTSLAIPPPSVWRG